MKIFVFLVEYLLLIILSSAQTHDLSYFLNQAIKNNPSLNKNESLNKTIDIELKQLKATYLLPKISADANLFFAPIINNDLHRFQWTTQGANDYTGYDLSISDGGQYQAMLTIEQPLFERKKLQLASRQLTTEKNRLSTHTLLTIKKIKKSVGEQYLQCLRAQEEMTFKQTLIQLIAQQENVISTLVKNGICKPSDLQRLKVEEMRYTTQYKEAVSNYRQALYDLKITCGITDTLSYRLQDISCSLNAPSDTSLFLKQFEADSLWLQAQQSVAEMKYTPQISVFANTGLNAVYLPGINRFGVGLGLKFSWLLFDGHQRNFIQTKTNIQLEELAFRKNHFLTTQTQERNKLKSKITDINEQLKLKQQQKREYDKLLEIYRIELTQGNLSIVEITNAIRDIASLQQEIILLKITKQKLIYSYNYWTE